MNNNNQEFVNTLLKRLVKLNYIKPGDVPNIDLYMDQVTTFMDEHLSDVKRHEDDKILTKTMINNYVKNHLIDAPIKKKYSKIQCAKIFAICILKQVYSMNEIYNLIDRALKHTDVEHAYNRFCSLFEEALKCAFNKEDFADNDSVDGNKYLLKSVLLSCSYKIYVQNVI